jgi:hypothetical protein
VSILIKTTIICYISKEWYKPNMYATIFKNYTFYSYSLINT